MVFGRLYSLCRAGQTVKAQATKRKEAPRWGSALMRFVFLAFAVALSAPARAQPASDGWISHRAAAATTDPADRAAFPPRLRIGQRAKGDAGHGDSRQPVHSVRQWQADRQRSIHRHHCALAHRECRSGALPPSRTQCDRGGGVGFCAQGPGCAGEPARRIRASAPGGAHRTAERGFGIAFDRRTRFDQRNPAGA